MVTVQGMGRKKHPFSRAFTSTIRSTMNPACMQTHMHLVYTHIVTYRVKKIENENDELQ